MSIKVSDELNRNLIAGTPGAILSLADLRHKELPFVPYSRSASGPQFVFSDDPEYLRVPEGAAVREEVRPGVVRLYVYHVNATTDTQHKKITAVIENPGDTSMTMRTLRYAFAGPGKDYYGIGKSGMVQYLRCLSTPPQVTPVVIAPGKGAPVDPAMEAAQVGYDELIHGWYDLEIDRPARITVLQTSCATPGPVACRRITDVLPPRANMGAGRGLYRTSTYDIANAPGKSIDTADGPLQLVVADGKQDPWLKGHDSSRDAEAELKGNYGVLYRIRLARTSSDGRGLAVVMLNPYGKGFKYCEAMAAAVVVGDGVYPRGVVEVPTGEKTVGGPPEAVLVQKFAPLPQGTTGTIELVYTPPGASCLPTPLLLIPYAPQ